MALCLRKSREIINKMGLWGVVNQSCCISSSSTSEPKNRISLGAPFSQDFNNPYADLIFKPSLYIPRRFESVQARKQLDSQSTANNNQRNIYQRTVLNVKNPPATSVWLENSLMMACGFHASLWSVRHAEGSMNKTEVLDFPGGKVPFSSEMMFLSEATEERIPCYRVLDDNGQPIDSSISVQVGQEIAKKMYTNMVTLQTMDTIFNEAQRQGRISFYVTTIGEEAINIASAAALTIDDLVVPQYREPGVLLWRGFSLQEFANQCFSNRGDDCKGRQMPTHYGSKKYNYLTVASTIASQLPHAVGAAYSVKMDGKDACVVTYFGDGGSSEGDFHAALNFAAVMEAPVIFICRNNGWAISTPTSDQFRSDGIVVKGRAYGVRSIRVDGNDGLAIYDAVRAAREMAISEHRPILVEALTYRVGHHTTSDDSTKYRSADEIEFWRLARDPVTRFRKWLETNGWWSIEADSELRNSVRKQVLNAILVAERVEKPPIEDIFTDVYDVLPSNLREQEKWLKETVKRCPQDYPSDNFFHNK